MQLAVAPPASQEPHALRAYEQSLSGVVGRTVRFRQLTSSPRLFLARGFLTEGECDTMCKLAEGFGYRKTAYGRETSDLEVATLEQMLDVGRIPDQALAQEGLAFLGRLSEWRTALSGAWRSPVALAGPNGAGASGVRSLTPQVREMLPQAELQTLTNEEGESYTSHVAIPMHLDTLVEDTYMTVIIYLRTVPASQGGHTLFPLATVAGASPLPRDLLEASRELIASGTWGLESTHPLLDAAAERLAQQAVASGRRRAGSLVWGYGGQGLAVSAKRGDALCFYTRRTDGTIDPAAWHAVAALSPGAGAGRCVCQLFHCLPNLDEAEELLQLARFKLPTANEKLEPKALAEVENMMKRLYHQPAAGVLKGRIAMSLCDIYARLRPCRAAGVSFEVSGDSEV